MMRIAIFVPSFPVVSETFILRQITGLIELGHEVHIFAERRPEPGEVVHPEVERYGLLERTTYTADDMPEATGVYEMPAWPAFGRTWLPGEAAPISNLSRLIRAAPVALRCLARAPRAALATLDPREFGFQAQSLSALYRLDAVNRAGLRFDVAHAHFGPQGNTFRFAMALWGVPYLVSFHGFDFSTLPRRQGRDIYARLFATADAASVNSEYTRNRVLNLGCPAEVTHLLPVGWIPMRSHFGSGDVSRASRSGCSRSVGWSRRRASRMLSGRWPGCAPDCLTSAMILSARGRSAGRWRRSSPASGWKGS